MAIGMLGWGGTHLSERRIGTGDEREISNGLPVGQFDVLVNDEGPAVSGFHGVGLSCGESWADVSSFNKDRHNGHWRSYQ